MEKIVINGKDLTIEDVAKVARCHAEVEISKDAKEKSLRQENLLTSLLKKKGLSTESQLVLENSLKYISQRI